MSRGRRATPEYLSGCCGNVPVRTAGCELLVSQAAAGAATPIELAALSPVSASLLGGAGFTYAAVTKLDDAARLASHPSWRARLTSGTAWDGFIAEVLGRQRNTRVILNGQLLSSGQRVSGSAVPDFLFQGGILEAKLSGAAVDRGQLLQFARYLQQSPTGNSLTYVFVRKPSSSVVDDMVRWLDEAGGSVELQIAYLLD